MEPPLSRTFYGRLRPVSDKWVPEALKVSGFSREETLGFDSHKAVMESFDNSYLHHFLGKNPFGYSSTNLGSFYKGLVRDTSKNFKHLRMTKHTHHPVDDARGNAEALLEVMKQFDLKIV